jgi:ribonucleoside-triphosphate reductase (formate)
MQVEKRDGRIEKFTFSKIENAVNKVYNAISKETPENVLNDLKSYFDKFSNTDKTIPIEDIQDKIRNILIKRNQNDAAETFILYRKKREDIRNNKSWLNKEIAKKLKGSAIENQNANVDEASFGGRIGEATRVVTKDYALKNIVSKMARDNHNNNMIYIHDLDSYAVGMHNCLSIPFDELLKNGFKTRQTDVRPANSVNTACQLVAVLFQIQSLQQFGGVSATHIDWTMVPYIRKSFYKHFRDGQRYILKVTPLEIEHPEDVSIEDTIYKNAEGRYDYDCYNYAADMTARETKQAVEGLYHNLNTLQSRSGNQLPFSSINFGTCTLPEGRMFSVAILDVSLKGLGRYGQTSIFPCSIFQYMKGVNDKPGTPNYDLKIRALESTAHRLYPNYANVDWSNNAGYDINDPRTYFSTMGCRTSNGYDINGLGQLKDGRGNICPVTIIMPTLAMIAKEQGGDIVSNFMTLLDKKIAEAKDMLLERFYYIANQDPSSAKFMWENNTMAGYVPEEGIISALKHGTIVIGQLGLAETLQILIGTDHTTDKGMELAKRIEQLFKDRCAEFKKEYHLNFGVYYSPAENLCYTAFKKWKAKYGEMENVTYYYKNNEKIEKWYFTNSIHIPVYYEISPFEKIDIESQLTGYSNAGCITYVEQKRDAVYNIEALEKLVDYAMEKDIPYFAINLPNDTCNDCHYNGLIEDCCPKCGSNNISRLRRVTGYLTGDYKSAFNKGKQVETEQRAKHVKELL